MRKWATRKLAARDGLVPVEVDIKTMKGTTRGIRYKKAAEAAKLIQERGQ